MVNREIGKNLMLALNNLQGIYEKLDSKNELESTDSNPFEDLSDFNTLDEVAERLEAKTGFIKSCI